ncbi:4483_t:CDS:2 [Funneliformis geosporum]|uniref:4483_t:CDS:1 n=1 Tax=Funneliformis geosporum TaxID=1117311 RepID=A0A9W4WVA5_9GLOM|nr:4483_t:CDS:2 [Funneliformis geosporum]
MTFNLENEHESKRVSSLIFGKCAECGEERISVGWCKDCEINSFKVHFIYWTSGNLNIDNYIKRTQLNACGSVDYLEYIKFDQLVLIKYMNKGGAFSTIYSAIWIEGPRWIWDEAADEWTRNGPIKVALKRINNSQNMSEEYINQLCRYHHCLQNGNVADCFGITKDPTSNYMFVMRYYENGDLHTYLDEVKGMLCWRDIVEILWSISGGIECIHKNELIHGNLHGGNLLVESEQDSIDVRVADVGLHGPADKKNSNEINGVLPYTDPEILKGNPPTKSSDIYSFGIIMWTLSAGIRPWCNRPHDIQLATEICFGLRPEIIDGTPEVYIQIMTQCWNSDPSKRPVASQLYELIGSWISAICDDPQQTELSEQFDLAEEKKFSDLEKNKYRQEIHSQAFYTSRPLYFPELIHNINTTNRKF